MKSLYSAVAPLALILAASVFSVGAYADQPAAEAAPASATVQTQQVDDAVAQQPRTLTRKEVYDQLVQAEKDGSLARLQSTIYSGG